MVTISEQPRYGRSQQRFRIGLSAVLVTGAVFIVGGITYAAYAKRVDTAKREGQMQIISAVGGMYAACTLEPIKHDDNSTQDHATKCAVLYETYMRLSSAY